MKSARFVYRIVALLVASQVCCPATACEYGDYNNDGKLSVADAVLLLRTVVGLYQPSPSQVLCGDVAPVPGANHRSAGDGALAVNDVSRLLHKLVGALSDEEFYPILTLTDLPPYGSSSPIQVHVRWVDPKDYRIATYIFISGSGYWTKPTFAQPTVELSPTGEATIPVVTGGSDQFAVKFALFLVRADYVPPSCGPCSDLPLELFTDPAVIANAFADRPALLKTILFAGKQWKIKQSDALVGPGPNYFSDSSDNVFVDDQGRLHLRITQRNGLWYCAEIFTEDGLDYGQYRFSLADAPPVADKNTILGLFTWDDLSDDAAAHHNREIDIEFGKFGDESRLPGSYTVQPYTNAGNTFLFDPSALQGRSSTHSFKWGPQSVDFESRVSNNPADPPVAVWSYAGPDIPPPGRGGVRINLWLFNGTPPQDSQEVEAIIENFERTL
jgi:hypothetical protein